jgi:hypothetical protein
LARTGKFDLEVTTFQMAVLFCWENRRDDKISFENLRYQQRYPGTIAEPVNFYLSGSGFDYFSNTNGVTRSLLRISGMYRASNCRSSIGIRSIPCFFYEVWRKPIRTTLPLFREIV